MTNGSLAPINDAKIYYETAGTGPPLLLLHAGVADSDMWDAQFSAFTRHFRTTRFDFRGYGRSNLPSGRFGNHEDVAALLDYLETPQTHLLGISFGGLVAIDFCLAYPDRVSSLILAAPSVGGVSPSERIQAFGAEEDELFEAGDLEGATEVNLKWWVDGPHRSPDQVDPAVRQAVYRMQLNAFQIPEPDELEIYGLEPKAAGRLSEIQAPTLVLIGDLDLEEKVAGATDISEQIPNARKVIIHDAAHMSNMEQPAQFNQAVLSFLGEA